MAPANGYVWISLCVGVNDTIFNRWAAIGEERNNYMYFEYLFTDTGL